MPKAIQMLGAVEMLPQAMIGIMLQHLRVIKQAPLTGATKVAILLIISLTALPLEAGIDSLTCPGHHYFEDCDYN